MTLRPLMWKKAAMVHFWTVPGFFQGEDRASSKVTVRIVEYRLRYEPSAYWMQVRSVTARASLLQNFIT